MSHSKKEPIWVYATQDGEGYTYSLYPTHEARVRTKYPHSQLSDRLFLAQDIKQDFAKAHQLMAPQLLMLLTKLDITELRELGPWEFRRPNEKDELLFTWPNETTQESKSQTRGTSKKTAPSTKSPRSAQRKAAG
jgi:hypothetical protein